MLHQQPSLKKIAVLPQTHLLTDLKDSSHWYLQASHQIWQDILSGRAEQDPGLLSTFFVLSYADLKHFRYYYW